VELQHIRSFLAVAETLNFSRAAVRVHLSQPGLSSQIRRLEREIGVRLLERNRRNTVLTPAGVLFRKEAAEALARVDLAAQRARMVDAGLLGQVRVGFISTAASLVVPRIVREFRLQHPDVALTLRNILTMDQVRRLEAMTLDVGFLRLPVEGHPDLDVVPVHNESFVIALPTQHPLAKKKSLSLKELAREKFVMYRREDATGFHDLIIHILRQASVSPEIAQVAGEMHTLVALVAASMGVAILPSSALARGIGGVVACEIRESVPCSTIGLATSKKNVEPTTNTFRDFALTLLRKPQAPNEYQIMYSADRHP
jgi:DNA-binding transcriptional LysR family regulator